MLAGRLGAWGRAAGALVMGLLVGVSGCAKRRASAKHTEAPRVTPRAQPRAAATPPVTRGDTAPPTQETAPKPIRVAPPARTGPFAIDPKVPLHVHWNRYPGRRWQHVSFRGSAGDRVPGRFRAAQGKGRRPVVILGHGHGGDQESMIRFFADVFDRSVHLLAVDHPFQGRRRKIRGQDICPPDPALLVIRWQRAVRDLRHAVRALRERPEVDPRRIGYLGFSLGAVFGGLLAGSEPHLSAAALVSPAGNWKVLAGTKSYWKIGWKKKLLPQWLGVPRLRKLLATVDPAVLIKRFAPRPLLLVVGRRDRVINPQSGLALYAAAGSGRVLWKHVGGHGPGRKLRRRTARWLVKQLTR